MDVKVEIETYNLTDFSIERTFVAKRLEEYLYLISE